MRRRWLRQIIYSGLTVGQVSAILTSATLSASLRVDPKQLQGPWAIFASSLVWIQNRAWLLLFAVGIYLVISEIFRKVIGPPWVWDAIHHSLDLFQDYAFLPQPGDMLQDHRVTLFRHVRWRFCLMKWPWSGWLVPVERSGHTTRRTSVAFRAPDDANEAEGVAGVTWAGKLPVPVLDLPDMSVKSSLEDVDLYAQKLLYRALGWRST
jgi:hypothetical protein